MGRHSCCYKQKLRKGLWSPEEDEKLLNHITKYGHGCWSSVPKQAAQLPGRTDNEIKNLWNSCLKKKLRQKGIDPVTHKPLSEVENVEQEEEKTKSQEKVTDISESDELNLLRSESTSKSDACSYEQKQSSIVLKAYGTEMEVEASFPMKNSILSSWGLTDCDSSTKENQSHIHMMENQTEEEEEAKWNEYLQNPMLMLQNQVPESLCNEIKPATNLSPDALGDMLPHSKQQESSQSYNIATFGH
ncbi:hypothetical protein TSUD_343570, partial [Trifolium subterraneum]